MTKGAKLYVCIVTFSQAVLLSVAMAIFGLPFDDTNYDKAEALFFLGSVCWIGVTLMLAKSVYQTGLPKAHADVVIFFGGMTASSFLLVLTILYAAGIISDLSQHEIRLFLLICWVVMLGFGIAVVVIAFIARRIWQGRVGDRGATNQSGPDRTVGD